MLKTAWGTGGLSLALGISLAETESTLAEFDRRAAGGSAVLLVLAVTGGLFLSRQALRPVAESIRTARRLDPEKLSERLPRTGAGDELDELAGTINGLLDRVAAYHAQITRFTADAVRRWIVEAHGGSIEAADGARRGTVFTVSLPIGRRGP